MKYHHIIPALIFSMLFSALSCQQKEFVHEEDISLKNSIQFQASEYEAILSRSGNGNLATKKTFLGMAGKDSLFILATVSENSTYDQVQTKAGESTPVLSSFHIKAYKDGENSPYVDEKLTSEDGWNTYSPTLYWPNTYDHIDFFAYSYDVGENLALTNFRITDGHIADFDYVTPSSVQPDLSFAIAPGQTEEDAPIDLDFFHTLAANLRYRETIQLNGIIYNLPSGSNVVLEDTYVSFALGYEVAYLTITRTGLRLGESAIYELYKNDENNFRIIITGDGTDSITKKIAVTAGEWIVREMPWSWTYDVTDNSIATDASTDANTTDRAVVHQVPYKDPQTGKEWVFVFNGTRQEISSPMNKEDIEINVMGN